MTNKPESAAVEAVAVIGPVWVIYWEGSGPIAEIARKHGLSIGDKLYPQSALDTLRGEVAAAERRVAELEAALRDLIDVADPVALAPREYERIREQTARGTCVSIDPFPLLKCRYEDVVDLTDGLKRARAALTKESP